MTKDIATHKQAMLAAAREANEVLRAWFEKAAVAEDRDVAIGAVVKNTHYAHYGYEDVFTQADIDSEAVILPHLRACLDIPVVAEESCPDCTDWPNGTQRWLVDPLDGTSRFKKGLPDFSITMALQTKKEGLWKTDIGLVSVPMENRIYLAGHDQAYVIKDERQYPLRHHPIEPPAFSGSRDDALAGKRIEVVSYSRENKVIIKMRDKLLAGPYDAQASFSTALVVARMAEAHGVDGAILAGNALDYDWDIHAAQHIAQKAGIYCKETRMDGEPLVLLAKSKSILNALEMKFRQTYRETKAEIQPESKGRQAGQ